MQQSPTTSSPNVAHAVHRAAPSDPNVDTPFRFQSPLSGPAVPLVASIHTSPRGVRILACDGCRRRKIKCDRTNPCHQCSASFSECTYSQPKKRVRRQCARPRADMSSRIVDSRRARSRSPAQSQHVTSPRSAEPRMTVEIGKFSKTYHSIQEEKLEFQGYPADRTFMQGLRDRFGDWHDNTFYRPLPTKHPVPGLFETHSILVDNLENLPAKSEATKLVDAALDAQLLLDIIHRPTFELAFHAIYALDSAQYTWKERRFQALLYAVLAYGRLFVAHEPGNNLPHDDVISIASHYYVNSRNLVDLAQCTDLISLQAVVFMNLFLLCTTRPITCYTYLSASLSTAIRMGLHVSPNQAQDFITQETGRRVFWALRLLCNETAACIGLPRPIEDDDISQQLPVEVHDTCIETDQILLQPEAEICYTAGANAYKRIQMVVDRIIKLVYPRNGGQESLNFPVKVTTIREIETDLANWANSIPTLFRLGTAAAEPAVMRARYVLALTYARLQVCLYRPLMQHFLERRGSIEACEDTSIYASACVQASHNAVSLCEDMHRRHLLNGADYATIRNLASQICTILYVIIVTKGRYQSDILFQSYAVGRRLLDVAAERGFYGARASTVVLMMVSTLPRSLRGVQERLLQTDREMGLELSNGAGSLNLTPDDAHTACLAQRVYTTIQRGSTFRKGGSQFRFETPTNSDSLTLSPLADEGRVLDKENAADLDNTQPSPAIMTPVSSHFQHQPGNDDQTALVELDINVHGYEAQSQSGIGEQSDLPPTMAPDEDGCWSDESWQNLLGTFGFFMGDMEGLL